MDDERNSDVKSEGGSLGTDRGSDSDHHRPPHESLVEIARSFVGTKESGNNSGKQIVEFQKAVDGVARGEPWCLCFVQFCAKKVDSLLGTKNVLYPTESVMELWNKTPKSARLSRPEVGAVMIWQHVELGKPTGKGHAGIVVEIVTDKVVETVEGNTGPGANVIREGDGVYLRSRLLEALPRSPMKPLGFLRCWDPASRSIVSPTPTSIPESEAPTRTPDTSSGTSTSSDPIPYGGGDTSEKRSTPSLVRRILEFLCGSRRPDDARK